MSIAAMAESPSPRPALPALAAAVLGAAVAVAASAPALSRPLLPGAAFVLLLPAGISLLLTGLLGWLPGLKRAPRAVAAVAALIAVAPWLAVAAAPLARFPLAAAVAGLAAGVIAITTVGQTKRCLAALLAAGLIFAFPQQGRIDLEGERSVLVLGFDAATWDSAQPLIDAGELPNFARLRSEGATGILMSEEPSASPRVWTTIATGVAPETHGILSFASSRQDLQAGRIWNETVDAGVRSGVVGWLVNWPPESGMGFSTPAWTDGGDAAIPDGAGFVKSMDILHKDGVSLADPRMIRLGLTAFAVSSADDAWRLLRDGLRLMKGVSPQDQDILMRMLRARLKAGLFLELLERERPAFSALVTYPTDQLGHKYWHYHEPQFFPSVDEEEASRYARVMIDAYVEADRVLGRILDRVDLDETTVILVSDHGIEALPEAEGGGKLVKVSAKALLGALGLKDQLRADYLTTRLILTPKQEGPEGLAALVEAEAALRAVRFADREGAPWEIDSDHERGFVTMKAVAGMESSEETVVAGEHRIPAKDLFFTDLETGRHHLRGVWGMIGPGVASGHWVEGADLIDVAPTALHALGLEVPADLDGEVLTGNWEASWMAEHPVRERPGPMAPPQQVQEAEVDEDYVNSNLTELGYAEGDEE